MPTSHRKEDLMPESLHLLYEMLIETRPRCAHTLFRSLRLSQSQLPYQHLWDLTIPKC